MYEFLFGAIFYGGILLLSGLLSAEREEIGGGREGEGVGEWSWVVMFVRLYI
jgi:hypothetical protein